MINSYAYYVRFSLDVFYKLNGVINNKFPARIMLFYNFNKPGILGSNYSDFIVIDITNIMSIVQSKHTMVTDNIIKIYIVYVIVHELSHLNQDYSEYYKLNLSDNITTEIIEGSNITNSYYWLQYLLDSNILKNEFNIDYDPSIINLPYLLSLYQINCDPDDIDLFNILRNSYYSIKDPLEKIKSVLSEILIDSNSHFQNYNNDIESLITNNHKYNNVMIYNILIDLKTNQEFILDNKLIYNNNQWVYYKDILDILYPFCTLYFFNQVFDYFIEYVELTEDPATSAIKIGITDNKHPIVSILTTNQE